MLWLFIAVWMFRVPDIVSMASTARTSVGQYHQVNECAWPGMQNFHSYLSGWLSALVWQANIAGEYPHRHPRLPREMNISRSIFAQPPRNPPGSSSPSAHR